MTPFAPTIGRKASSLFLALILTLAAAVGLPSRALAIESLPSANESDLTDGTVNGTNWMSYISGERYLNEMTIPGTHDASMCKPVALKSGISSVLNSAKKTARTQDLSLSEQLDVGVRVFDLRLTNHSPYKRRGAPDGVNTYLCHGPWNGEYVISSTYFATTDEKTAISFSMAMGYYTEFLRQHPTETVLLSVNNEYGAGEPADVLALARAELDKWAATTNPSTGKPYIYMPDGNKLIDTMPKLSDTRGQIVVLAPKRNLLGYGIAFDTDKGWTSGAQTANVRLAYENHYEATNEDKVDYVAAFYNGGTVEGETIDAQKGTISPTIQSTPLDYVCFVNTSSNRLLKVGWLPRAIAEYVNPRLFTNDDALLKTRGVYYGWVNVDFVTDKIAQCIWLNNFPEGGLKYSSVSFTAGGGAGEPTQYAVQQGTTITLPDNMFTPGDQNNASFVGWTVNGKLMQPGESVTADTEIVEIVATWGATWNDLQQAILQAPDDKETTITLTTDVVAQRGDQTLVVPKGKSIVIEMNGHAIDKRSASLNASGGVFDVDGKLTLKYGTVTGGKAERGGGILVDSEGRVTLRSVTVTGNTAQSCGGGVHVTTHPEATKDAFEVSGTTSISGNKLEGSGADSNVWLARDTIIDGVQNLSEGATIGVATEVQPTSTSPVVISSNLGNGSTAESHLVSESDYYIAQVKGTSHGNIEYYAAMMAPLQVTFDSKGGSAVKTQLVKKGERATKPANPLSDMRSFTGWYIQGTNTAYDFTQPVKDNLTLEAHWKTTTVSVTFDSDGGSEVAAQAVDFGKTATRPADPTREGYQFVCWKAKYESTSMGHTFTHWVTYTFDEPVIAATRLKAFWKPVSCTVSFDANGGDPAPATQTVGYGAKADKPTDPRRTGYAFLGWYEDGKDVPFNFDAAVLDNVSLTAKWRRNTQVVTFDAAGGVLGGPNTLTVNQGTIIKPRPDDPTREGHLFTGWQLDGKSFSFSTPITADITLVAGWEELQPDDECYEVIFDEDGGSAVETQRVEKNGTATEPNPAPTRDGYDFAGWYTDKGCTNAYNFSTPVTEAIVLYAKWTPKASHTVTFDSDGGSNVARQTITQDGTVTKPADPTKDRHSFEGWYLPDGTPYDFDLPVTSNFMLKARWQLAYCSVSFDSNGGSGVAAQTDVPYGGFATKPADPTQDGCTFDGWYLNLMTTTPSDSDWATIRAELLDIQNDPSLNTWLWVDGGDTAGYTLRCSFDFASDAIEEDVTLYARWQTQTHTVAFDANAGGDTSVAGMPANQTSIEHGTTATEPGTYPTRDHYLCTGWYIDEDCADTDLFDFATPITNDLTLYAGWQAKTYAVTFDAGGGSPVDEQTVAYNEKATKPTSDPTREGYEFVDWYADAGLTTQFIFADVAIDKDTVIYAKWNAISCKVTFETFGGSPKPDAQTVAYNNHATKPSTDPTLEGHTFAGWYARVSDEPLSADLISEIRSDAQLSQYCWIDDAGYLYLPFDFATDAILADTTLYARWTPDSCTISFDATGGTPTPDDQQLSYNSLITKPADPTREGYVLDGWYFQLSDETLDDKTADEIRNDAELSREYWVTDDNKLRVAFDFEHYTAWDSMTLYARWAPRANTATFVDGEGNVVAKQTVLSGEAPISIEGTGEFGYDFLGWYADESRTTPYDFAAPISSDVTIYGAWEPQTLTVSFDSNGGSEIDPKTQLVAYEEYASRPEDPKRAGYTFLGWYEDLSDELSADELDEYKAYLAEILSDEDPDLRAEALEMLDARYTVVDGKVMSYYEPEFDPVTYDLEVQALWQEGYVTSEVVVGDGAPQVTASNLDAVARALATDEEVGLGMHVTLKITALSEADVSDQDKALLEARAKELGITVDQWLDISLYKSVAGGEPVQIHELPTPLIIHLTVPTNLQATGDDVTRTFYLLRSHDGQASFLAKGAEAALSGATDRLSTHLLGHLDVKAAKNAVGGTDSTTGTTGATGTSSSQAVTRGGNPQTGDTYISVAPLLALGALFLTSGIIVRRLLRKE